MKVNINRYPRWFWFNNFLNKTFGYTPEQKVSIKIERWDTYSMDYSLALIIHPLLIKFKEDNNGYPSDITSEEWDEILDQMIFAFSWRLEDNDLFTSEEDKEKAMEGFRLFGKWFTNLWW